MKVASLEAVARALPVDRHDLAELRLLHGDALDQDVNG